MRPKLMVLGLLVLSVIETASAAALGAARPEQAQAIIKHTRYLAWMLGSRLSYAALEYGQGGDQNEIDETLVKCRESAKVLGTSIPAFPSKTGDRKADRVAMLKYLLKDAAPAMAKEIYLNYPEDHGALFELGVKSNALMFLYSPGNDWGKDIANQIVDLAKTADLPAKLWRPVVGKVYEQALPKEVAIAVQQMHEDVKTHLEQGI